MSEKRRISTRNRGEPPLKKRALSPPAPTPQKAAPAPPPPAAPVEEGLPVKLRDGRTLPTQPGLQNLDLPFRAYQTVSERFVTLLITFKTNFYSGVLAASIERSRQRWTTDGIFDRYWSKPSKKKDLSNTPNPAKETMTRLGICSMIIDPHVFEVTLYTVKDAPIGYAPLSVQPPSLSAPQYNPFPPSSTYAPPLYTAPRTAPLPSYPPQQHAYPSQPSLPPFREGFGSFGPQGPPPIYRPPIHPAVPAVHPEVPNSSKSGNAGDGSPQSESSGPKPDPVIGMLATRAASHPALKALMKVVASGKASPPQLRDFQDHIDELNAVMKSRRSSTETPTSENKPGKPPGTGQEHPPQPLHPSASPTSQWNMTSQGPVYPNPYQVSASIKREPSLQSSPTVAPLVHAKSASYNKADIDSIVFDFGGMGDRFSFPRFSILEYLYGGTQVIVSFLVIRRGNTAPPGKYKGNMSYYQPVTMRLTSPNPKLLEPLPRIVAPPDEVRQYMNSFFDKLHPAETVYLATRLPRMNDAVENERDQTPIRPDMQLARPVYSPPNSIMPLAA